jgi:hypothetical protein
VEYLLLLYSEEKNLIDHAPEQEREAFYADMGAFVKELEDAGAFVSARRLQTAETSTTLRLEHGEPVVTDGPYAETKEQLAGFFLIDCKDLDQALDYARRIPHAKIGGTVEVRPRKY